MRELDTLEQKLKQQQQEATQGLEMIGAMRKMLEGPPTPPTNGGRKPTPQKAAPHMTRAAKQKQKAASKAYWAKVQSGEIKRKGYTPKSEQS